MERRDILARGIPFVDLEDEGTIIIVVVVPHLETHEQHPPDPRGGAQSPQHVQRVAPLQVHKAEVGPRPIDALVDERSFQVPNVHS